MAINGIVFPLEISLLDETCIICYEKLQWPIFCPQCKQGNCYECLGRWFQQKQECPKCRHVFQLQADRRGRYGCPRDGNLIEFYCEQCVECICRACTGNLSPHYRHPVRSLDALRREMVDAFKAMENKMNLQLVEVACSFGYGGDIAKKALQKIKSLIPMGSPLEWVQQQRAIQTEIDKIIQPVIAGNAQQTTSSYYLPNTDFEEKTFFLTETNTEQLLSATDRQGNTWELTVYPGGYSDAKGKFISLYLKLVRGTPLRYEYRFKIFDKGNQPLETYYAVDDFTVGSQSTACQRLIDINQARQKAWGVKGYQIAFATRPTDPMYGLRCATALAENKLKRLNYRTFTYMVHKFSYNKVANRILFSNIMFDHQNISWRFRIDCNGHWEQGEYVSVFLELLNGVEGWFDIFIKVYNPNNPTISFKRELTHKFTVHSNWGVPHFIHQSAVYPYLCNDQLKFDFGMRPAYVEKEM
ncbi:uncharacterized protein LOC135707700 [Ochlerotatus camptorhynchus]|uniref:uncharacterized protein LOC135707700 n=1 Tax=Ochlerotatus camptorhynchus TaxID=644619 RepID=UPI0031CE579F